MPFPVERSLDSPGTKPARGPTYSRREPTRTPPRAELERTIERYNEAWNAQDLDPIVSFHAPGMVFENHTAGERAEGADVREHIGQIFANWPDLRFRGRGSTPATGSS